MSFEVRERDLLARIGKLKTKSSAVETPLLFPVVNPSIQPISPKRIETEFSFEALITNAYIIRKRFQNQPIQQGLHKFLNFNGAIMTDSGAYQILVYGNIDTTQKEIIQYQEQIDTDIATILDIPTGWKVTKTHAEQTVEETLKRAKQFFNQKTRDDILWVGPVQGGKHLDLVAKSAAEMAKLPFGIYALGSPTEIMEQYRFDVLVDMILTAKTNLPIEKPLHLFGAGHPFMFALAVALGCDLFDSAAYAIYARQGRYMTENGTHRLNELEYFPCQCPRCTKMSSDKVSQLSDKEQELFLAEHNLYVCSAELKRIKQAIRDGRLWEHLEMRAHGHPALLQAVKRLNNYKDFIEKHAPTTKPSGLFYFSSLGLARPEIIRHKTRMTQRYSKPKDAKTLLLLPQTQTKPFHKSKEYKNLISQLHKHKGIDKIHVCFYAAPFGVIPNELDEVYPLSQHETALPLDKETIEYVATQTAEYINNTNYKTVILIHDPTTWKEEVLKKCSKACFKKNIRFKYLIAKQSGKAILARLEKLLQKT